ncbi:hypothetical protein PG984_007804 [Apiospora sp. TS-2023a]
MAKSGELVDSCTSLGRSTGDHVTISMAKGWLDKCLREHQGCSQQDDTLQYARPARLLDLQHGVRLVDSSKAEVAPYVTLSHCWGDPTHVTRLLSSNEALFRQGQIRGLPQTFLDAIYVTMELGYRYLWVDSLCIIQDSKQDWEIQAKTMALVYANSVFTIAAVKSSGSTEGCFTKDRNPLGQRILRRPDLGIMALPIDELLMWFVEVDTMGPDDASPLHSRAWVIQERHSSPRTLLYGKHGIYWECRCAKASEHGYIEVAWDSGDNRKTWLQRLLQFECEQGSSTSRQPWVDKWNGMLTLYSGCQLTVKGDKIIAFTGLLAEIERRSRPARRCILGIWDHDLPRMALWNRCQNSDRPIQLFPRLTNGMPTWSWASVEGSCHYMIYDVKLQWRADIHIDESPTPASMVIRSWRRNVLQKGAADGNSDTNTYPSLALGPTDGRMGEKGKGGNSDTDYRWWPDCVTPDESTPLQIVQIARFSMSEGGTTKAWCLVIMPKPPGAGEYERVGLTVLRYREPLDDPFSKEEGLCETIRIV